LRDGDKTQLVALAFAMRFSVGAVIGAVFSATLLVHFFSVAIGELLGMALPSSGSRCGRGRVQSALVSGRCAAYADRRIRAADPPTDRS